MGLVFENIIFIAEDEAIFFSKNSRLHAPLFFLTNLKNYLFFQIDINV